MNGKKKMKAAFCIGISLALCAVVSGCEFPTKVIGGTPAPDQTVTDFFDGICEGDYAKADACLSEGSVSLENEPESAFARSLLPYLQQSCRYRLEGDIQTKGIDAEAKVQFTCLDPYLMADDLQAKTTELGKMYIRAQDTAHTQVTGGVCTLTDQGAEAVAIEALDSIMTEPDRYYSTGIYSIRLRYEGDSWKMMMNDALFEAIAGAYSG